MKTFFTYFLIFFSISSYCQTNLITNGSFEDIDSCYGNFAPLGFDVFQWSGCLGWSNPTYASSDLWCKNGVVGTVQPPNIPTGYQFPRTGNNMAGIIILETIDWEYREYLQCNLLVPLKANKFYQISYYVNTAGGNNSTCCINTYFSKTNINNPTSYLYLPFNAQVKNSTNNLITDTLGWTLITETYKASGNEQFITIGCFDDYYNIQLTNYDSLNADGIYFFIDDVEVTESPFSFFIPNIFTPNVDGNNDIFSPNVVNINEWECFIYNRWGQEVYKLNNGINSWDGRTTGGKEVPEGTYYYVFTASIENEKISEKGFITLLR